MRADDEQRQASGGSRAAALPDAALEQIGELTPVIRTPASLVSDLVDPAQRDRIDVGEERRAIHGRRVEELREGLRILTRREGRILPEASPAAYRVQSEDGRAGSGLMAARGPAHAQLDGTNRLGRRADPPSDPAEWRRWVLFERAHDPSAQFGGIERPRAPVSPRSSADGASTLAPWRRRL